MPQKGYDIVNFDGTGMLEIQNLQIRRRNPMNTTMKTAVDISGCRFDHLTLVKPDDNHDERIVCTIWNGETYVGVLAGPTAPILAESPVVKGMDDDENKTYFRLSDEQWAEVVGFINRRRQEMRHSVTSKAAG